VRVWPIEQPRMNANVKFRGAVVPLVTPVTAAGELDSPSLDSLIDFMLTGSVEGIFVLGTTGEGVSVPRAARLKFVQETVARVRGRAAVYAGIGDTSLADSVRSAKQYFQAGVDAVVAQPPAYFPLQPHEVLAYFQSLLAQLPGPMIIYNIPATTRVSIPLDVVGQLLGHPRLAGMKDSENDPRRLEELIKRFGGDPEFSIFIGVGAFMARGLKLGAEGIVPSVGNLIPDVCHQLWASAARGDWAEVERHGTRMLEVAGLYQKDRTLGQSLAALKASLHWQGIIGPHMLPPLLPISGTELQTLRTGMSALGLLD
jgi:dihydrodipicolinate synthase/N-acetylneuraminate lyase